MKIIKIKKTNPVFIEAAKASKIEKKKRFEKYFAEIAKLRM